MSYYIVSIFSTLAMMFAPVQQAQQVQAVKAPVAQTVVASSNVDAEINKLRSFYNARRNSLRTHIDIVV